MRNTAGGKYAQRNGSMHGGTVMAGGGMEDAGAIEPSAGMPAWMDIGLPWGSSGMLHLGVGLIVLFLALIVRPRIELDDTIGMILPPTMAGEQDPSQNGNGGGIPHPGIGGDPTRDAAQEQIKKVLDTKGWADHESKAKAASFLAGNASANVLGEILRGSGATIGGEGKYGTGSGDGGPSAPWGTPGGGNGIGEKGNFYGVPNGRVGGAKRIAYVLDHSGSLLDNFNFLQKELKRSTDNLMPFQQFGVVVFAGVEEGTEILTPGTALVPAFKDNTRATGVKMDRVVAKGKNDDELIPFLDALQKAFAMKPQVIYFLTDGRFDARLISEVAKLNKDKAVVINCIAFVGKDDGYFEQMRAISSQSGGMFKFVSEREVAGP